MNTKRILTLAAVLALAMVMAMPMAALAVEDDTGVSGTIETALTLQAPGDIVLPILTVGTHLAESTGSVYSTAADWTIAVTQAAPKTNLSGKLTLNGADVAGLTNALGLGTVTGTRTLTVATYDTGLKTLDGATGPTSIPLFVSQERVSADSVAGLYSLTLTYTATPLT